MAADHCLRRLQVYPFREGDSNRISADQREEKAPWMGPAGDEAGFSRGQDASAKNRIPLSPFLLSVADLCLKRLSFFLLREGDSNQSPRRPTGGKGAKVVACATAHTTIASTPLAERSDAGRRKGARRVFDASRKRAWKTESSSLRCR